MNAASQILGLVASAIIFIALIPALWVSGRIILRNPITTDRSSRLFLWLVLGGFFLIPLHDLLSYAVSLLMLATSTDQRMGEVVLFMGTTSWLFYTILITVIGIINYSLGIYYGRKIIDERRLPVIRDLALSSLEQDFMVLGLAGLLDSMVTGIISRFFSISIPVSDPFSWGFRGALVGLMGAFIILAIVIIYMELKLKDQQA